MAGRGGDTAGGYGAAASCSVPVRQFRMRAPFHHRRPRRVRPRRVQDPLPEGHGSAAPQGTSGRCALKSEAEEADTWG